MDRKFHLGHVELEMLVRLPGGEGEYGVGRMGLRCGLEKHM